MELASNTDHASLMHVIALERFSHHVFAMFIYTGHI